MRIKESRSYRGGDRREKYNFRDYRNDNRHARDYGDSDRELANYNLAIGLILLYGFGINYLMVRFATPYFLGMNPLSLIVAYFVLALIGILMSRFSDSPVLSFIGYTLVVVPLGMVLCVCLAGYGATIIANTAIVTVLVSFIMMLCGALFPRAFLSMGRALGIALLTVIIVELICGLLLRLYLPTIWDVLVALIFCGYIGYDWANAQLRPHTLDNAIDACVSLYLDIINLFLRILSISGDRYRD